MYKSGQALAGKGTGLLYRGLATHSQQHYILSSLAQSLVKRRWTPLDALKSVPTNLSLMTLVKYLQYTQYQVESDINAMVMVAVHVRRYNLFSAHANLLCKIRFTHNF